MGSFFTYSVTSFRFLLSFLHLLLSNNNARRYNRALGNLNVSDSGLGMENSLVDKIVAPCRALKFNQWMFIVETQKPWTMFL